MTGVIGFLQARKSHWLKKLLGLLFLCALVPILNSAFQLFNASYYARWFYMLTLMMVLATVQAMQSHATQWKRAIRWTAVITLGIALPIGLMPNTTTTDDIETTTIGLEAYPTRFWSYVAIALLSLLLLTVILKFYYQNTKRFLRCTLWGVSFISVIYAAFFIALGKTQSEDAHKQIIPYALNKGADLDLPDLKNCRSDFYESMDNQGMFWQIPTIQAFHSIVPGSIMEFYPSIGVTRDVGSRPGIEPYGLRGLTSCRWLFDYAFDNKCFSEDFSHTNPKMPGWTYYDTQNGFDIWENQYYIPMGFSYDYYISEDQYEETPEDYRNLLLLKAILLSDEQIEEYKNDLYPFSKQPNYTQEEYFTDCIERKATSCSEFSYDNDGFSATFTATKPRLVFFSVPYESGWSATVNGQSVNIEKVNVGFMAVRVPEGTSTIRFTYTTPGLKIGALVTIVSFLIFVFYLLLIRKRDRIWNHYHRRRIYRVLQPLPKLHSVNCDSLSCEKEHSSPSETNISPNAENPSSACSPCVENPPVESLDSSVKAEIPQLQPESTEEDTFPKNKEES